MSEFPIRKYIDVIIDPIQLWYPTLWMHKTLFFIYQFYDSFLRGCREISIRAAPAPVTKEAKDFLSGNGNYILRKNTRIFDCMVSKEHPSCYQSLSQTDFLS